MCATLFPDIITALEVKDSLNDIILISKRNNKVGGDNYFKKITKVYVSAERCAKRQKIYAQRGLGNVFLGYGYEVWTEKDYVKYFDDNPSIFKPLDQSHSSYSVELGDNFIDLDNLSDGIRVNSLISNFCSKLLTQETYNPRLLAKLGFA